MTSLEFKTKLLSCDAFIFDMDGTLVDLENLNFTTFEKIVNEKLQLPFTQADYQTHFSGAGSRNGFTSLLKHRNIQDQDIDQLVNSYREIKKEILNSRFHEVVILKPGTRELLDLLTERGIKKGLATSSFENFARMIMDNFDLTKYFDVFLTESDITLNKPDPEIFNLAISRLGSTPATAVLFEDSFNGIKSAKSTGAFTVGLKLPGKNDQYMEMVDYAIDDYHEIVELMKS